MGSSLAALSASGADAGRQRVIAHVVDAVGFHPGLSRLLTAGCRGPRIPLSSRALKAESAGCIIPAGHLGPPLQIPVQ